MLEQGNAYDAGEKHAGWILGHFQTGNLLSNDVEIKWKLHPAGDRNGKYSRCNGKTISILVRGCLQYRFVPENQHWSIAEIVLENEGDFVSWGPEMNHDWIALKESLVMTVRWPSLRKESDENRQSHESSPVR